MDASVAGATIDATFLESTDMRSSGGGPRCLGFSIFLELLNGSLLDGLKTPSRWSSAVKKRAKQVLGTCPPGWWVFL